MINNSLRQSNPKTVTRQNNTFINDIKNSIKPSNNSSLAKCGLVRQKTSVERKLTNPIYHNNTNFTKINNVNNNNNNIAKIRKIQNYYQPIKKVEINIDSENSTRNSLRKNPLSFQNNSHLLGVNKRLNSQEPSSRPLKSSTNNSNSNYTSNNLGVTNISDIRNCGIQKKNRSDISLGNLYSKSNVYFKPQPSRAISVGSHDIKNQFLKMETRQFESQNLNRINDIYNNINIIINNNNNSHYYNELNSDNDNKYIIKKPVMNYINNKRPLSTQPVGQRYKKPIVPKSMKKKYIE